MLKLTQGLGTAPAVVFEEHGGQAHEDMGIAGDADSRGGLWARAPNLLRAKYAVPVNATHFN